MKKPNVRIWFYGGIGEIGGTKILIEDLGYDVRVFLDFGKSFSVEKQYYSYPHSPNKIEDLIKINAVPDDSKFPILSGLYSTSDILTSSHQKLLEIEKSSSFEEEQESNIDAILLSHVHSDHYQYISLVNRSIPIYVSECGHKILQMKKWIERPSLTNNLFLLNFKTFKTGHDININGLKITPIHVDHSIPASYGFVIHTSGGTIVYTGDFRFHGHNPLLTYHFYETILRNAPVELLITEATHISKSILSSEEEVEQKIEKVIHSTEQLVVADFSNTDFDRFRSYYNAAKATGRYIVITPKQSLILSAMNLCEGLSNPNIFERSEIKILIPKREDPLVPADKERLMPWQKIYYPHLGAKVKGSVQKIDLWKPFKQLLHEIGTPSEDKLLTHSQLIKSPRDYILCPSFNTIGDLQVIKPVAGSIYILSTSEPFDEEREIQFDKLLNWLELYGMPMLQIHVSGHVQPLDLKSFIMNIFPKNTVPVHTTAPQFFQTMFQGLGLNVSLVKYGDFIEL